MCRLLPFPTFYHVCGSCCETETSAVGSLLVSVPFFLFEGARGTTVVHLGFPATAVFHPLFCSSTTHAVPFEI